MLDSEKMFSFVRNHQIVFQSVCIILHLDERFCRSTRSPLLAAASVLHLGHPVNTRLRACLAAQLYPDSLRPTDCSLPGSSFQGILQARILEWVAMPSSRGSS